jgi:hypothetical protein
MQRIDGARAALAAVLTGCSAAGGAVQAQSAPPAQIDKTTPHAQDGLTVLAVSRGDAQGQYAFPVPAGMDFLNGPRSSGPPGGIGLWVRGPKPSPTPAAKGGRFQPQYFRQPTAIATALNGDTLPVQAEMAGPYSYSPTGGSSAPLFLVTLPGGYPAGYPAIDVRLNDAQGHSARWRLIRLAAPVHAIAPPVAVHSTFTGGGVQLSVRAWRDSPVSHPGMGSPRFPMSPDMAGVHYEVTAKTPAGSTWLVRIEKRQLEWEAVSPGEQAALMARYGPRYASQARRQPLWTASFGSGTTPYPMQDMVRTPYGKYDHYLRLSGELVQMASAEESVTFHNITVRKSVPPTNMYPRGPHAYVPPPSYEISTAKQTIVTPSGISISLLPLSALGQQPGFFGYGMPGSIRLLLGFGQAPPMQYAFQPLTLPKSPLYRRYHKPVTYTLQAMHPYMLETFGGFGLQRPGAPAQMLAMLRLPPSPPVRTVQNGRVIYRMPPPSVPTHLDHLTLNVSQRAELRTVPVTFVVPIGDQAPPSTIPTGHPAFPALHPHR